MEESSSTDLEMDDHQPADVELTAENSSPRMQAEFGLEIVENGSQVGKKEGDLNISTGTTVAVIDDFQSAESIVDLVRDASLDSLKVNNRVLNSGESAHSSEDEGDDDTIRDDTLLSMVSGSATNHTDRGDPSRRPGADAAGYIDPDFLRPFFYGWRREVLISKARDDVQPSCRVSYIHPPDVATVRDGKRKRRNRFEVEKYFDEHPSPVLSAINFSFNPRPLGLNNEAFEVVIDGRLSTNGKSSHGCPTKPAANSETNSARQASEATDQGGEGRRRLRDRSLLVNRSRYGMPELQSGSNNQMSCGYSSTRQMSGKSLAEALLREDEDISVYRRFLIGTTLVDQIGKGAARLRYEHRKRRRGVPTQPPPTPPLAADAPWTPCISDDPLGVFTRLSSQECETPRPTTPPNLRAVHLATTQSADAIREELDHIKSLATASDEFHDTAQDEEKKKKEADSHDSDTENLGDLDLVYYDIPEAGIGSVSNLASHDVMIRKFKNYTVPSLSLADSVSQPKGGSSVMSSALQAALISRMLQQSEGATSNGKQFLGLNRNQNKPAANHVAMISLSLPMDAPQIKGVRPLVDIVILNDAGRYQPVRFARAFKITEVIPRWRFDEADRLQRSVYMRAKSISSIRQRPLMLAINPSSRAAGGMSVERLMMDINRGVIEGSVNGKALSHSTTVNRQLQNSRPTGNQVKSDSSGLVRGQSSNAHQEQAQSAAVAADKSKDQVAILVRPFNAAQGPSASSSTRLLNIPRRVVPRLKVGLTLSFSSSATQKYTVVSTKLYPPVKPLPDESKTAHSNGRANQVSQVSHPVATFKKVEPIGSDVRSRIGSSVSITPSANLASSQKAQLQRVRPNSNVGSDAPAAKRQMAYNRTAMDSSKESAMGLLSTCANVLRQQVANNHTALDNSANVQLPKADNKHGLLSRKIPSSVTVSPLKTTVREQVQLCTPFCPGAQGPPDLMCNSCQTIFHGSCMGFTPTVVNKISASFKCKVCLNNANSKRTTSQDASCDKPPIIIDLD